MKASLQYIFRIPLKWEVTPKGLESMPSLVKFLWDNMFHIFVGLVLPTISLVLCCLYEIPSIEFYICVIGILFHIINLLACITIFAKVDQAEDRDAAAFSIDTLLRMSDNESQLVPLLRNKAKCKI